MTFQMTAQDIDFAVRLMIALVLGGVVGFERETHGKEAGFRTYSLVSVGSALMMIVSIQMFEIFKGAAVVDPSRIAAQVVTGIGFIGAGAIIRAPEKIRGLTTAAGIWTVSGIGLACGAGLYKPAVAATALALIVLVIFSKVNRMLGGRDV
jgi:putative Mg2+ transporter-C (MgtC) family protein